MKKTVLYQAILVALMVGGFVLAGHATSPKMKMTTEIPPGIASPDKVETRLGTLNFFGGPYGREGS